MSDAALLNVVLFLPLVGIAALARAAATAATTSCAGCRSA